VSVDAGKLIHYLNDWLKINTYQEKHLNGLQVQGPKTIERVAFAVDAAEATIEQAVLAKADLMIVHHGLFWGGPFAIRGPEYRKIAALINHNLALYAVHLPLDGHLEVGHAATLLRSLTPDGTEMFPFGQDGSHTVGAQCQVEKRPLPSVIESLKEQFPQLRLLSFGNPWVRRMACVTGQGASFGLLHQARLQNIDLYLTGEANHPLYHFAMEHRLNVALCGHYATETLGLQALSKHLAQHFEVTPCFLDHPTDF
jgi:dinuclear metal center YbgI/SA1388 family protein